MDLIQSVRIFDQTIYAEGGAALERPRRKVAACAVVTNPYAGSPTATDAELRHLAEMSHEVGTILVKRALPLFAESERPTAYGKAAIVGIAGQREHGAAAIHLKLGLAMRRGLGAGPSLIPGNEKQGGPGSCIDLIFGDIVTGWDYDAMDSMEISVPGAPRPDEILLIVGFSNGRPGARVKGATQQQVQELLKELSS